MTSGDNDYMIWSNEHERWWGPDSRGYVAGLHGAGVYTKEEALRICRNAILTAPHIGKISELPVRRADIEEFLQGAVVPAMIYVGRKS